MHFSIARSYVHVQYFMCNITKLQCDILHCFSNHNLTSDIYNYDLLFTNIEVTSQHDMKT